MKKSVTFIVLFTFASVIFNVNAAWFHQANLTVSKTDGTPTTYSSPAWPGEDNLISATGNLGLISDGVLKLSGDAYIGQGGVGSMVTLNYQIDGQSIVSKNLTWNSDGHYPGGGGYFAARYVLSEFNVLSGVSLAAGSHTITIYYTGVGTNGATANNGSLSANSIKITFEIPTVKLNVNVPPGTEVCYVAGSWNGWTPQKMDVASAPYDFTISFGATAGEIQYKYCSGPDWKYEELQANGSPLAGNRTLTVSGSLTTKDDVVAKWKDVPKFVKFTNPATSVAVVDLNTTVAFEASALKSTTLNLYISEKGSGSETLLKTTSGTSISYNTPGYTFNALKSYWVIAEATTPSTVRDSVFVFVKDNVVTAARPALPDGINIESSSQVTFILCAPGKNNVFVVGDFNNWLPENTSMMKKDGDYWWLTVTGLDSNVEYAFQYLVDGNLYVGDPYAQKVLDPWNDPYISSTTYPDLKPYPAGKNTDDGMVSVFQTNEALYNWKYTASFQPPRQDKLMIYELFIRDFTAEGDLNGVMSKLDYLQGLGINAIELMPTQEFDGNDSWGYNPCYFFAMDKAYGTKEMYKDFIDECHRRGIAVILDVVYNHATGSHPFAKLYWNSATNKTASNNPWFNVDAPHAYDFFHDFNHFDSKGWVKAYFKRNLKFLLEEYKFDGFRFDFTKGFTQTSWNGSNDNWNYDQSRVDILKEYHAAIETVNPKAYMILEHLCDDSEERVLGDTNNGMMPWANKNVQYCQAAMGYQTNSDFNGINGWTRPSPWTFDNLIGYMESHDEERLMYKAKTYGATSDIKNNLAVQMERAALCAAFFLPIPGAKMIWQFGELGYDYSIDYNGRTGRKPIPWDLDYDIDPDRKALYDTYAKLNKLRDIYSDAFDNKTFWDKEIDDGDWDQGRWIRLTSPKVKMVIIGNFKPDATVTTIPNFPATGIWYDYMTGEAIEVTNSDLFKNNSDPGMTIDLAPHKFKILIHKDDYIWKKTAVNSNWDDPDNWNISQIPHKASFVTITGDAGHFPILTKPVEVNEIHFQPGAQIGNQSKLTGKAFVQYDLKDRHRWQMLSIPLGQVYPADFGFGGYPLTYLQTFSESKAVGESETVTNGSWVNVQKRENPFSAGDGFILWVENDDTSVPYYEEKGLAFLKDIRELPFFHHHAAAPGSDERKYYEAATQVHDYDKTSGESTFFNFKPGGDKYIRDNTASYTVSRDEVAAYQLAAANFPKPFDFDDGNFALFGNPFMAAFDFGSFYTTNSSMIKPYYQIWVNGQYKIGGSKGDLTQYIAPLQAFLVEKCETGPTSGTLTFDESMASVNTGANLLRSSGSNENRLDIVARNPVSEVRTIIAKQEGGQTVFGDLDARKITNGISDVPEIYTLKPYKNGKIAVAINLINTDELLIPLGLATSYAGVITLSFSGMDTYNAKIRLIDALENREIDLTGLSFYDYTIDYTPKKMNDKTAVCNDRFFISISMPTGLAKTIAGKVNVYESNGQIRIVSGASNPIKDVLVYDLQGMLVYKATSVNTISHTVDLNRHGAYIVKVISEINSDNVKLIIR